MQHRISFQDGVCSCHVVAGKLYEMKSREAAHDLYSVYCGLKKVLIGGVGKREYEAVFFIAFLCFYDILHKIAVCVRYT